MNAKSALFLPLFIFLMLFPSIHIQPQQIIESTDDHVTFEFDLNNLYSVKDTLIDGKVFQIIKGDDNYYRNPGEPWLPMLTINIGVPHNSNPVYKLLSDDKTFFNNKFIIPFPANDPDFEKLDIAKIDNKIYGVNQFYPTDFIQLNPTNIFRYTRILPLSVSPFQFNPVTRELIFHNKLTVRVEFNTKDSELFSIVDDAMNNEILKGTVINFDIAKRFSGKLLSGDSPEEVASGWYDPNKNYFKIFLKEKGVYRVSYTELINSGVPLGLNTSVNKLELFNMGELVPIDIVDSNADELFNSDDYFQFVGFPPPASPYAHMNLYNLSNVYWFSYESDSTGNHYKNIDGFPQSWDLSLAVTRHTLHFEKDSMYERMGYDPTGQIDHWFWGSATAYNGQAVYGFEDRFSAFANRNQDSNYVTLRVQMHGKTNSIYCDTDHKAEIKITDQLLGYKIWDGQTAEVFEKKFYISADSIRIFPTGNRLNVWVRGDICANVSNDDIRINWYEFEYWRNLKTNPNNFIFKSHAAGKIRFWTTRWYRDNMKIYIPERNKLISNPNITNDQYNSVFFVDTANIGTEYFCVADDYYLDVDSIVVDQPSNLKDISNGADYIIITHPNFLSASQDLADLRSSDFPDPNIESARIFIVDINQVYDEFSGGLLDPFALKYFVQYAFENWQNPAPSYVVLMGDMSYDYRGLLEDGHPNFIPSIPIFAPKYGQAVSDNSIVAVSGTDIVPDLAIGRLSCETIEEANILVNKLINYPADDSKSWKQNMIFLASGIDTADENTFHFNDASLHLGNQYVKPFGYNCTYIFRFPSDTSHDPYQGEGPEMREKINEGGALVNYYGHGGGSQWDLVFTNDDIDLLENEGRLPVILSLTCYTAHFDNQKIFGEHFNLAPNRGSVGFYGSSGITYWNVATNINLKIYNEIFPKKNMIIGKSLLNAINQVGTNGVYKDQIPLMTYLGDPAMKLCIPVLPDFVMSSSNITISPESPLAGDTVIVNLNIDNLGRTFPLDSVSVELFASSTDTSYLIGSTKLPSFGERDSVKFVWTPIKGNLFTLRAQVNEKDSINEVDHSDNIASQYFIVFNLSEPNILTPDNATTTVENSINFNFSEIGYYIGRDLSYLVEIDTSMAFLNPVVISPLLSTSEPILHWQSPNLTQGVYFWRSRIFDGQEYGKWSPLRSFTVSDSSDDNYCAHDKILQTFKLYNVEYSDSSKGLRLNTDPLPARPDNNNTLLKEFTISSALPDSLHLTALTTDGTYLYFGNMWWTASSSNGKSMIYRVGTGYNGTTEGQFYGTFSNFRDSIFNSITYHSDGYIYIPTGNSHQLTRINTSNGAVDSIEVSPGLLRWENATTTNGPVYLTSDGQFVYNITLADSLGNHKYTLRTFDPSSNWTLAREDIILSGSSYNPGFSGFFVHGEYIYPAKNFWNTNTLRRIRLSDGFFEEEWSYLPYIGQYAWCLDWIHDKIYTSTYSSSNIPQKIQKFAGYYIDTYGEITTKSIGPASSWNNLSYELDNPSPTGEYITTLFGFNNDTKLWDTLGIEIPDQYSLSEINSNTYPKLQLKFSFTDSSLSTINPMELKSVNVIYKPLPNVYFKRDDLTFTVDSSLQGFPITMKFNARNFGRASIDNFSLNFYLNGEDSVIYSRNVTISPDSLSPVVIYDIVTDDLLFDNSIRVLGNPEHLEYFSFDNLIDKKFYVARDSIRPTFSVTFDGQEIINGDIISAKPDIEIILEDNSPLPLDTSYFTIVYDDSLLHFNGSDISYNYTPYPNSKSEIHWTPEIRKDGAHTLFILAKDASGNFYFDSTNYSVTFYVFNESDVAEVYNYPNPFKQETHFTFSLRGTELPEEIKIKVYTIAGRLIRELNVPPNDLVIGFNKVYWNGRDEDGDEIGNGVYLYKLIARFSDKTKSITQKLARVR